MDARLGAALSAAARSLHSPTTVEETLDAIARTAQVSIPGIDAVGISTIDKHGNVNTRAATGDLVWELDKLQYSLGEGPCVDTLRESQVVVAPRIRHDQRWPRYVAPAVELGLRAQLAVRLYVDDAGTLGGLNLYATESEDIEAEAEVIAELFAAQAAVALGNARKVQDLSHGMQSRQVIGQAVGMLMNQYTISADAAFALLARTSSHANVKIRDIAAQMVAEADEKAHRLMGGQ